MLKQSTKNSNGSNVPLTKDKTDILKLSLSFTPTLNENIAELENHIYQFTRKLRLTYHGQNSNIVDESIKLESTNTPKQNKNTDLETSCKELEHSKISLFKTKDNLHTLKKGLESLIKKIENNKIIIRTWKQRLNYR